ncbi:MAG: hypothetical protein JWM80_6650 [Cyanobacteria bacterium RYN_339]|nr:hypothetical protein [Cyanobacteria bacterium RYN_339]
MSVALLEAPVPGPGRADAWVGLAFAVLFAAFVAVSWQKWPLLTADSARELYVPFQIRHGATIYRDFAYLYGPVAPYGQAGLLALFGEHLAVLYVASLAQLALVLGLLYTLARHVLAAPAAAAVLWLFFGGFALGRDIWGYVWPYSFAATHGVLFGLVVLVALCRHAASGRRAWLALAGLAVGLSLVTKLEFGLAAAGVAAVYGGLRALARPGWRVLALDALAVAGPACAVAGAIAATVLASVPAPMVLESIWPTRLMQLWGSQGTWHGTAQSWGANLKWLALALATCAVAVDSRRWWPVGLVLVVGLAGFGHFYVENAAHYWMGPGFLVLFGLLVAVARRLRAGPPSPVLVAWALVGAYGLLVATRTLMLGYNDYTRYQAPVALIAWVALASRWLPAWLGVAPGRPFALAALALALGGQPAWAEVASYLGPHEAVTGPVGTVLATPTFARPFNQALAYVRAHTRPGDAIVAAPMEASFYLFSGLDNVLHEDQLFWGYLTTHAEQAAALRRMEDRRVRYVLVSSYAMGPHRFGENFMEDLGAWIHTRCALVGDFSSPGYGVRVYATPFAEGM